MNDYQVVEGLLYESDKRRYEDELYLRYNYFIREGCTRYKLTEDESFSAYSDAVIAVLQSICSKKFEGRSSLKTYLYQVFSNKCVDHVRHNMADKSAANRAATFESLAFSLPDEVQGVVEKMMDQFNRNMVATHVNATGEKCMNILQLFEEGFSDKDIAEQLNYQTAAVAKTSRLRCLDKLRMLIKKSGVWYEKTH